MCYLPVENFNNVEPDIEILQLIFGYIHLRHLTILILFERSNRLNRSAVAVVNPSFHLDENIGFARSGDNVNLAREKSNVSVDNLIARTL